MNGATRLVPIHGNTYPVKEGLKALGARWHADKKVWMIAFDKLEAANKLVAGTASIIGGTPVAASEPQNTNKASASQLTALRNMLRKLDRIALFDSFGGTGEDAVYAVREDIEKAGGYGALTRKQASEFISAVSGWIDDEM